MILLYNRLLYKRFLLYNVFSFFLQILLKMVDSVEFAVASAIVFEVERITEIRCTIAPFKTILELEFELFAYEIFKRAI